MTYYKSKRPVNGKPPIWIIVDETGKIININPSKDELKGLKKEICITDFHPNRCKKLICYICENKLISGHSLRERNKEENVTGRWICHDCYNKDYQKNNSNSQNNIRKSLTGRRTGNLDPNSNHAKGDISQELACMLYEWIDLNKENDNYTRGTPVDCYDPKTGLYHQVQGRYYSLEYGLWPSFGNFKNEWFKKYKNTVCICYNKDGKIVERIYKFPKEEIIERTGISIIKDPIFHVGWYEKYRVTDEDELKRANEILKDILIEN